MITGLKFGSSTFDPRSPDHETLADGVYRRWFNRGRLWLREIYGQTLTLDDLETILMTHYGSVCLDGLHSIICCRCMYPSTLLSLDISGAPSIVRQLPLGCIDFLAFMPLSIN